MIGLPVEAKQLADVCRRHHIRELAVFGSAARGDAHPDSDIDVLVEFEPAARIGFIALSRLNRDLETLLGRRVDVVTKRGLNPLIRERVQAEAEVVFAA